MKPTPEDRARELMHVCRAAGINLTLHNDTATLTGADEPTRERWASILRPIKRQVLAWLVAEQTISRARSTTTRTTP